jgi:glycosyltransferase involved in cell wall biosynthesis
VVEPFRARHPRFRYVRLAAKGGVDQDYHRAVELAEGDYVWLMTDDDLLKPGAVAEILGRIGQGHDLIVVNAEVRDPTLERVLQPRRLDLAADRVYGPADWSRCFAETGDYLSFIGAVVIRRSRWRERQTARYFGTLFIHVGVIFQSPLPGTILALATPWIVIRYGNAQWSARSFPIWMFMWPDLVWSFSSVSDPAKAQVTRREPWRRWRTLAAWRAKGAYSLAEYREHLRPRCPRFRSRLPLLLVALLPAGLLAIIAYVGIRLRHRADEPMSIFNLVQGRAWPF